MCDHLREKRAYRNIIYCKKCNMVLGLSKNKTHIRSVKPFHKPIHDMNSLSVIDQVDEFKLKLKNCSLIENADM